MFIYKTFDKVFESALFVVALIGIYFALISGSSLSWFSLVVNAALAGYWGRKVFIHWRAELQTPVTLRAAYGRVVDQLALYVDKGTPLRTAFSPNESDFVMAFWHDKPLPGMGPYYSVALSTQECDVFADADRRFAPRESVHVSLGALTGYVYADVMEGNEPTVPSVRSFTDVMFDRPQDRPIVTEAQLVAIENALKTWRRRVL